MIKSIDEDIQNTLEKLHTLLEYSTSLKAEEVFQLIAKAKQIWEEEEE